MTNNADAQIARKWVEAWVEEPTNDMLAAVYRHILATTAPPTMADIAWDDEVHAGLVARHYDGDLVRMIGPDWDDGECIICIDSEGIAVTLHGGNLTPIPGTKIDLTPRREPEPEPTPDHPTELTTEEDYLHAPAGTLVAAEGEEAWTKNKGGHWETDGIAIGYTNYAMARDDARQVLRWGWSA